MASFCSLRKIFLLFNLVVLVSTRANAQIKPDSTLGNENSTVTPNQTVKGVPSDVISGGAVRGTNLFHSFENFNINSRQGAYFTNPSGITNILTRVTGNNPSNIFGVLGVLGNANLFFINPHGIIFGPNASLALNGSFIATTASSINLSDGTVFTATDPQSVPPLLTVSVPIGLGFTEGSTASIHVQGTGHNFVQPGNVAEPDVSIGPIPTGLELKPGHTLALVGGDVSFTSGVMTAPSGRIEVGSVSSGQVSITPNQLEGFSLSYEGVQNFQDILLERKSLLNASGTGGGDIQIVGRNVQLTDSSLAFIQNQGISSLGTINVNAFNSLTITGNTVFTPITSGLTNFSNGLISQTFNGKGADIRILTKQLTLQNGGRIYLSTFGLGAGGNLSINASTFVKELGNSPFTPSYTIGSYVATVSAGAGNAGNITLNTKDLSLQNGSALSSASVSNGAGGNISVDASNSIDLNGFNSVSFFPSIVSSTNAGSANGGNLFIYTKGLTIQNGGRVDASSINTGLAGSVTINASDFVKVNGTVPGSINPSLIISSANRIDPILYYVIGLPLKLTGTSGSVVINTGSLSVTKGGLIAVSNDGPREAGTLTVNARSIFLDNKGGITAATASGRGGNILLSAQNLQLGNNNLITATAGGSGNGGNITIKTGTLAALENSRISADAVRGKGGNIQINVQGLFQSPDSKFTASSNLGINGTVQVKTLVNNSTLGLVRLPIVPVDAAKLIAQGCGGPAGPRGNKFVVTGSGGFPSSPTDSQDIDRSESDWGTTNAPSGENHASAYHPSKSHNDDDDDFVEATGAIRNAKGQIELVANAPTYTPAPPWIKPAGCRAH